MLPEFRHWQGRTDEDKKLLKPDLNFRSWGDLTNDEKRDIWLFLEPYFKFLNDQKAQENKGTYVDATESDYPKWKTINQLNENHKQNSPAKDFLYDKTGRRGQKKGANYFFENIFINAEEVWVMRMLSYFAVSLIRDRELRMKDGETESDYLKRNAEYKYENFDILKQRLDDVFGDFNLDMKLTRKGFVFRQDKKILDEIYEPTLSILASPEFEVVNRELEDAFKGLKSGEPGGYSSCIGHSITALEAFLAIQQGEAVGKDTLGKILNKAFKSKSIPSDPFTKTLFDNWESILMQERQSTGHAHVKKEYATKENAQTILNLAMIFIQHCFNFKE